MDQQQERPGARSAVVLTLVALAAGSVVLGGQAGETLRGLAWLGTAGVVLRSARDRPERAAGWRVIGVANVVVAAGWLAHAGVGAHTWTHGIILIGAVGLLAGTISVAPAHISRTSVLDGLVVALSIAGAIALAVVRDGIDVPTPTFVLSGFALFIAVLLPTIIASMLISGALDPTNRAPVATLSSVAFSAAMVATAMSLAAGEPLRLWGVVVWVIPPIASSIVAQSPGAIYEQRARARRGAMDTSRVVVLLLAALLPIATASLLGDSDHQLLLAAIGSLLLALLLVARIVAAVRYEIADERVAADVRFDALVEHSAEVVALARQDGTLFYVSRPAERAFGIDAGALVGTNAVALVVSEYHDKWAQALDQARRQPAEPVHTAVELMDARGIARHVECTIVDLCHLDGVNAISLTVRDVTERIQLETELMRRVRIDDLTGVFNRHVITDRVQHVLTRRDPQVALLYLDVDDFKSINDGHGHAAGDAVLTAIGRRLHDVLRIADTAGRLGGDEFAILLEDLDSPRRDVVQVCERIREACSLPVTIGLDQVIEPRVSIGVAMPREGITSEELFAAADAAMYRAKHDQVGIVVFDESLTRTTQSRRKLLKDVRPVVIQGSFEMHYQPIVNMKTGELDSVEALLRWHHPELGWVPPDQFLVQADAAGLTAQLTSAVLGHVGVDLRRWRDETDQSIGVAINLSAEQLAHLDAGLALKELIASGLQAEEITLEITETSMLGDLTAIADALATFRRAGCHIAIDDFGTGFASIGYLRRLPVDLLKIDREFIEELTMGAADGSFAATINRLAADLSLRTVAEGIETEEQLAAVRLLGCDFAQGYLLGRPKPMSELVASDWGRPELRAELIARAIAAS